MREARGPAWTDWLVERSIPALSGIDTRSLVDPPARARSHASRGRRRRLLRGRGADGGPRPALDGGTGARRRGRRRAKPYVAAEQGRVRIAVVDYGCKRSIVRRLIAVGAAVTVFPHDVDADELAPLRRRPPLQRPRRSGAAHERGRRPCASCSARCRCSASASATSCSRSPTGHETFKLKFGHRGANHPVLERATGRVLVTSQNHGFAVAPSEEREATHVSLYDGTVEGLDFPELRARSVQFHPEAGPGPHDAWPILEQLGGGGERPCQGGLISSPSA